MPAEYSKTHSDYMWLIPDEFDYVTQSILACETTGFVSADKLYGCLQNFFKQQVLGRV